MMRAQTKALMNEHGFANTMDRSYMYDTHGLVKVRHMKTGSFRQEVTTTYKRVRRRGRHGPDSEHPEANSRPWGFLRHQF